MLLIRRFEEKVEERFRAGELPGFLHVAIGQEASRGRRLPRARGRRRHRLDAPRARAHAREGHAPERADGRAVRQGRGLLARLRRLDAPLRRRAREHGRERRHRRRPAARHRRRARVPDARRAARRGRVLRRRRDEHRHVPRVAQPRAAVEGPGGLRARGQQVGGVDAGVAALADPRPLRAREGVRDEGGEVRRPGRRGRLQDGAPGARARALGQGPRVPAPRLRPAARPLHRRPAGLPRQGRGEEARRDARPDHDAAREARALRRGASRSSTPR